MYSSKNKLQGLSGDYLRKGYKHIPQCSPYGHHRFTHRKLWEALVCLEVKVQLKTHLVQHSNHNKFTQSITFLPTTQQVI